MKRGKRKSDFSNNKSRLSSTTQKFSLIHKKRNLIKIFLFIVISVILVVTFSFLFTSKKYTKPSETQVSPKLAYGKGINFVEYHGDKKVYSVSIDSFSIERERLGPFAIGPLRVAHLKNVKVDLFLDDNDKPVQKLITQIREERIEPGTLNLENPVLSMKRNLPKEIKKIKGIKLKNISFNLWKNEKKIFSISSDTATVDRETGDIIFTGHATMDAGDNGKLVSHRIRWVKNTQFFRVTEAYYFIKDGKKTEGKGIETDYLFKKINYKG